MLTTKNYQHGTIEMAVGHTYLKNHFVFVCVFVFVTIRKADIFELNVAFKVFWCQSTIRGHYWFPIHVFKNLFRATDGLSYLGITTNNSLKENHW